MPDNFDYSDQISHLEEVLFNKNEEIDTLKKDLAKANAEIDKLQAIIDHKNDS